MESLIGAQHEDLPMAVLPERHEVRIHRSGLFFDVRDAPAPLKGAHPAVGVITEEVPPPPARRKCCAAVYASADHRDSISGIMPIVVSGRLEAGLVASRSRRVASRALHDRPAKVLAALTARDNVDLLQRVVAHVTDVKVARRSVEPEPEGLAKAVRPDLR